MIGFHGVNAGWFMTSTFHSRLAAFLIMAGVVAGAEEGVLLPWGDDQATVRQVIALDAPVERVGPVVFLRHETRIHRFDGTRK